eukprot:scaffold1107_cov113-Skeletonema_marinoi.AAC.2
MGYSRIAIVAVLTTLMMLHQLRNQDLGFVQTISETSKSSARQLLNNTAPVWKTAARVCKQPVHLEGGWYKSQSREDRTLEKWFKDICHGTYMEIGGLDGVRASNSYVYNKGLNWTGVLVEASPRNYQQLVINRPNEIANVHAESLPAVGGFQEFASPEFQKRWWSKDQIQNAQVIKCHTLEQILLDKVGPGFYFDFFSLDVEGAELSVLRSINFDLVGFGVIVMEVDGHNATKNIAARILLQLPIVLLATRSSAVYQCATHFLVWDKPTLYINTE